MESDYYSFSKRKECSLFDRDVELMIMFLAYYLLKVFTAILYLLIGMKNDISLAVMHSGLGILAKIRIYLGKMKGS